jgi:hypothetical protein
MPYLGYPARSGDCAPGLLADAGNLFAGVAYHDDLEDATRRAIRDDDVPVDDGHGRG